MVIGSSVGRFLHIPQLHIEADKDKCINCGRCAGACPLKLMPNRIARAYKQNDLDELANLQVTLCMECGCCTYVCPAKRDLVLRNKLSKAALAKRAKRG